MGIVGFSNTLAIEGRKYNIVVNSIAPNAGTRMTATVMPPEMVEALKPEYVAPLVLYLGHEVNTHTAGIFEVGSGWVSKVRWQRSGGVGFPVNQPLKAEQIAKNWSKIVNFDDGRATYPTSTQESFQAVFENMSNQAKADAAAKAKKSGGNGVQLDPKIESAKKVTYPEETFSYTDKEVILYNLGVGATKQDLDLVYENHEGFTVLPTFAVSIVYSALSLRLIVF